MSKTFKLTITLAIIAGLSGLILSVVNDVTEPVIYENQQETEKIAFEGFFDNYDHNEQHEVQNIKAINYWSGVYDSSDQQIGYVYSATGQNGYGEISLLVAFDMEDNMLGINYIKFGQTPGFGDKVQTDDYLSQFNDVAVDELNIDAATGATFSSKLVDELVSTVVSYHKESNE